MEQIAGRALRARPDRNRHQHDVSGRKACDAQGAQQLGRLALHLCLGLRNALERHCLVAKLFHFADQESGRTLCAVEPDGDPPQGQVDARRDDPRHLGKPALDGGNARAAVNAGHVQHVFRRGIGQCPPRPRHLLVERDQRQVAGVLAELGRKAGTATVHRHGVIPLRGSGSSGAMACHPARLPGSRPATGPQ